MKSGFAGAAKCGMCEMCGILCCAMPEMRGGRIFPKR